jgi:hypothetical protein
MKVVPILPWLAFIFLSPAFCHGENLWQAGRIANVTQNGQTSSSIVNPPLTGQQTVCVISVQVGDKIYTGSYVEGKDQPAPPSQWIKGYPVRVQFVGEQMILRVSPVSNLRVKVSKRNSGTKIEPLTPQEEAALEAKGTAESVVDFDQSAPLAPPPEAEPAAGSPASSPEPATATVSVSSVPYLANLYVDGEDAGYTPAKVKLSPGEHIVRCEKKGYQPWTKAITVGASSELALDATLKPKK